MPYINAFDRIALLKPRVRGLASLEGMDGQGYPCWVDPEDPRTPVFTLEVGQRVAADCSSIVYGVRYDPLSLTFCEYSDQECGDREYGVVADCAHPCPFFTAPDGERVHAIGFWHGWAWDVTPALS